jgi:AbrB family looped-hinge helix DNA binding protein
MKARIDSVGRIYLPKDVREQVGAEEFLVEMLEDGSILLRPVRKDQVEEYYGVLKTRSMTVEEMEEKVKESVLGIYRNDLS